MEVVRNLKNVVGDKMEQKEYRIFYSGGYYIPQSFYYGNTYNNFTTIFGRIRKYKELEKAEKFIEKIKIRVKKRIDKWYVLGKAVKEL